MDENKTSCLSSNLSGNNLSHLNNNGEATNTIYVFTPAGNTRKHVLCLFVSTLGVLGFLGNCAIFSFLGKNRKRKNQIQSNYFVRNLNLYIRSLSLSDLLSCAVAVPLLCIQILYDVFQTGWPCKIVRYLQFIFTAITINTLVVISLEKYLTTRKVLRTVGTTKMRKMIISAWVFGMLFMLPASVPYDGIRVDLNTTHFTVICKNDEQFYPFKLTLIVLPFQYVLPCVFVIYVNICLIKTVWVSGRRKVVNVAKNAFQAQLRAKKIRGITLIILLTFAFVVPFSFFLGNIAYMQIARPQLDFSTTYMARYGTGVIVFLSPSMNFVIYFVQMKDFREFLKNGLWRNSRTSRSSHGNEKHLSSQRKTERVDNAIADVKEISIHQLNLR